MNQVRFPQPAANLAAIAAMTYLIVVALTVLVAGAFTPGYSHVSQFISELGARGSPHEWAVRFTGFLPAGLSLLAFCGLAFAALPRSTGTTLGLLGLAIYAAGYLVAVAFPCDLGCRPAEPSASQLIHNASGLLSYLLTPAFLFVLARAAHAWPNAGPLGIAGYVAAGLALIGLYSLSPSSPVAGLSQRLLEGAVLVWVVLCGRYLARQGAAADG